MKDMKSMKKSNGNGICWTRAMDRAAELLSTQLQLLLIDQI